MWCLRTVKYSSPFTKEDTLPCTTRIKLEGITLSEISQSQADKYRTTVYTRTVYRRGEQDGGCQRWRVTDAGRRGSGGAKRQERGANAFWGPGGRRRLWLMTPCRAPEPCRVGQWVVMFSESMVAA